ncbi:23S rRNA (adenine(2503)-C(2))-methyltransferase RlmN [Propionicicella superfundia]|uniref:23S rRNA (adenine(2503)-C(2))-methyltransferase RlmN n=1 Tax=Propionicicella superfundia TaxID=348582 RepID=UPI0004913E89
MAAPRRGRPPQHWADLDPAARVAALTDAGLPRFRAAQLSRHYFVHHTSDPDRWSDIPAAERAQLREVFFPRLVDPVRELRCDGDTTVKTLWRLHDGSRVESVLMRYGVPGVRSSGRGRMRTTVCVSSQAGCGMACPFCATGQGGLTRNLSAAEILDQVVVSARMLEEGALAGGPGPVNNVVFMGMGEPMANFAAVLAATEAMIAPAPDGLGISARGVTISTVGLVPRIRQLTEWGRPVTLAVSLHAPDDDLRDGLVPINSRWKVAEVLDAAWEHARATRRRVSIEYALIKDVNDQAWRADLLATLLRQRGDWGWVHVNLIPLNPTPGSMWTASDAADQDEFVRRLEARGVPVTVRDTRGREIDGACGQLAALDRAGSA